MLPSTTKSAIAEWDENIFGSSTVLPRLFVNPIDGTLRPVRINNFFILSYIVNKSLLFVLLVYLGSSLILAGLALVSLHKYGAKVHLNRKAYIHFYHYIPCPVCIHTIIVTGSKDCYGTTLLNHLISSYCSYVFLIKILFFS